MSEMPVTFVVSAMSSSPLPRKTTIAGYSLNITVFRKKVVLELQY